MIRGGSGWAIRIETDLFKIIVFVWKKVADINSTAAKRSVDVGLGISGFEKP